ncbi:hypothetical protein MNBD_GAMMA11-2962 [hydrothermal vent metagenome]|uniref:CDP-glycerol:poly(Glycerophosphate) glycerophosphotransferase n=1 Tax=hydrothermal vent metagenome TaxID=652676 RepID=A0A3B0X5E4_9ZZZZ
MPDLKRTLVKKYIRLLRSAFPWAVDTRKHIVFEACEKFHYFHMEPIIENIIKDGRFRVSIVKWSGFDKQDMLPGVNYLSFNEFWHDWFNIYDILITTELERRPGWFQNGTAICMFHGAGPKMSYIKNPEINAYDVVFSVGPMTYKVQQAFVKKSVSVEKIGLPITDGLISDEPVPLPESINLDSSKPTLLYAPSWSTNPDLISMDNDILDALAGLHNYNVIIRPHPLLLAPEKCRDFDWNPKINELKASGIQISYAKDHSIYEIMQRIDVLLGDISSVTYEYLVFDKPVVLYMKEGVLAAFDAEEFATPLLDASTRLNAAGDLKSTLNALNDGNDNKQSAARKKLRDDTFYNIGTATECAVRTIEKYAFD